MSPLLDTLTTSRRPGAALGLLLLAGALVAALFAAAPRLSAAPEVGPRWSPELVEKAALLPVQEGGRVKPLDTYAGYTLLRLNHKRSCKNLDGSSLTPTEWLLDVLFRPAQARRYACFAVDNDEVLDAVGLSHEGKKKRDRYTFEDLAPGLERLSVLAREYHRIPDKERTAVEAGVVQLAADLGLFDALTRFADFARPGLEVPSVPALQALWPGRTQVTPMEVVARVADLRALMGPGGDPHAGVPGAPEVGGGAKPSAESAAATQLVSEAVEAFRAATLLNMVPPARGDVQEWLTPGDVLFLRAKGDPVAPSEEALVGHLAALAAAPSDAASASRELLALQGAAVDLATQRGEYQKVPLEVALARWDFFYRAVYLYITAFLLLALSWWVTARWVRLLAWLPLLLAVGLHLAGIVVRCVLRDRPPISTLYDTTLSIAVASALACMVAEWLTRRGVALALAPVTGGLILFVGLRFDVLKAEDTMPPLQAVLDTNFWLALHVTAISLGYMGGLVASAVAHVHVLGRALGAKRLDYALLSRLTYGMLAFALILSVSGTILGGIWANESWGRFWGWDPKENGALMICLAQLAILHARLGGMLKPFGVALATIVQGCVVAFSWWGVNLLGIGLHSYGFTGGIFAGLMTFYAVEGVVLLAGLAHVLSRRAGAPAPQA